MVECIFCRIVNKEIPTAIVYEDDHVTAFLDVHPATKGHTLVIPKKHYEQLADLPEKEYLRYMLSLQKVVRGLLRYAPAVNVLRNEGKEAGQLVPHVHFHIIPRRPNDGLHLGAWRATHEPDLAPVQKTIQSLFKE